MHFFAVLNNFCKSRANSSMASYAKTEINNFPSLRFKTTVEPRSFLVLSNKVVQYLYFGLELIYFCTNVLNSCTISYRRIEISSCPFPFRTSWIYNFFGFVQLNTQKFITIQSRAKCFFCKSVADTSMISYVKIDRF